MGKAEDRAALEEQIRALIKERNAAEGAARTILERRIADTRRQLKALG